MKLFFAGRKDFQIKHMGHRIELEEIERAISSVDLVERVCCVFDPVKDKLYAFYVGEADKKQIREALAEVLPVFMIPGSYTQLGSMPITKNGKIDRKALAAMTEKKKK